MRETKRFAQRAHFVLEQHPQRLNQLREAEFLGQTADVVMALDDRRARRLTTLDNVRVNRALREVIQLAKLFGFRLEHFQEVTADNLALRFGVGNALQILIEDFAGVGRNQTHGESVREDVHNLLGFA